MKTSSDLFDVIKAIREEKDNSRIVPNYATDKDINKKTGKNIYELKDEIKNLLSLGLIRYGKYINGFYFEII